MPPPLPLSPQGCLFPQPQSASSQCVVLAQSPAQRGRPEGTEMLLFWAQDNGASSPFHQATNQWPVAGVPPKTFIWPGLPQTSSYLGPERRLRTSATPSPGALVCLTSEKQRRPQATRQGAGRRAHCTLGPGLPPGWRWIGNAPSTAPEERC